MDIDNYPSFFCILCRKGLINPWLLSTIIVPHSFFYIDNAITPFENFKKFMIDLYLAQLPKIWLFSLAIGLILQFQTVKFCIFIFLLDRNYLEVRRI